MKIAVFGTGAVGGYFGGRLRAAGETVTFIARGRRLAALRDRGMSIVSPLGDLELRDVTATDRPDDAGPVDVVLFTVKLYDAEAAAEQLAPMLGAETAVVTLQNGVEFPGRLATRIGARHVVPGAAYIMASLEDDGRIVHLGADRLVFGESTGERSPRLLALEAAGARAGFRAAISESIEVDLWIKFVRLATWSGVTALSRSTIGVIRERPALSAMMRQALDEAIAVAAARGIALPETIRADTEALVAQFPHDAKSSMLDDLEHGRRLELPWLSGAIARMARESGLRAPIHELIAAALEPFVGGDPSGVS